MKQTDFAILSTLSGISAKHEKTYCYPSQRTILGLLKSYHQVKISRRTLNRRLKVLENEAYFERVRRILRGKDGAMIFRSTLYKLRWKLFNLMGSLRKEASALLHLLRVPFLANHLPFGRKASSPNGRPSVDNPGDNPFRGT